MSDDPMVAIFWDYENCCPPSNSSGLGYDIVNNITRIARLFGSVSAFRAYLDISAQSPKSVALRSELQSSGVSIIDCPHNGKKDVVDKMILVDMLAFAIDHPAPATVFLIAGDRDYAYAVSILKLRKYQVILVVPSLHASPSLESQASLVVDWATAVLRTRTDTQDSVRLVRQPHPDLDAALVSQLLNELQDLPLDEPDPTVHPYVNPSPAAIRMRRVTTRDLLEPSRHSKNTDSLDSTQDFAHNPLSINRFTDMATEPAPVGPPIPKTPSRSRHASVSTGSTRARSTTVLTPSSSTEHCILTASQPNTSDPTSLEKCNVPTLTSLDALELPLNDDGPPSSIIVRSPLEHRQWTCNMSGPSSHKLNSSAAPFVTKRALTTESNQKSVEPTFSTAAPPKAFAQNVGLAFGTLQRKDDGIPTGTDRSSLCIEKDRHPFLSRVRSEGTCEALDLEHPNSHARITSESNTTHPLSDLHFADTPLSDRASLPAAGGSVDSAQCLSRASNIGDQSPFGFVSALSCSSFRSQTPSDTPESCEDDESERCRTWTMFGPLVRVLLAARGRGILRPPRSIIALDLVKSDALVYQRAGVLRFRDYTALAEQAGVIELGGRESDAWIALRPNWLGASESTTTQFLSSGEISPTLDTAKVFQHPLSLGTEMIESAMFQALGPRTSESSSPSSIPSASRRDYASWNPLPTQFQPLVDALVRLRAEGFPQPRRSVVGQMFDPSVYSQAGVSGFKEYIQKGLDAQFIECGGVGGFAWIRLHPDLRI